MTRGQKQTGFTIVELLIVIVVIGILAAITIVAYGNVKQRAATAEQNADTTQYIKAINLARNSASSHLWGITTSTYSAGGCLSTIDNPSGTEPKDLPKSHNCWKNYYDNLTRIGQAAGVNLDGLRSGDSRGNPYALDENEGEQACPSKDVMYTFTGSGITRNNISIPRYDGCG